MKRKVFLLILIMLLALILSSTMIACTFNGSKVVLASNEEINNLENVIEDNVKETYQVNVETILLGSDVVVNSDGSKTQVVSATVEPTNAVNKNVTWSVSWNGTSTPGELGDYITIVGYSRTCHVTCHKKFGSDYSVLLTAKSVDNPNVTATSIITYAGLPDSYQYFVGFSTTPKYDIDYINDFSKSDGSDSAPLLTLNGINSLGLGSEYKPDLEFVSLSATGTITYNGGSISVDAIASDIITRAETSGKVVSLTLKNLKGYIISNYGSFIGFDGYFYVTVKDNANNGKLLDIKFVC